MGSRVIDGFSELEGDFSKIIASVSKPIFKYQILKDGSEVAMEAIRKKVISLGLVNTGVLSKDGFYYEVKEMNDYSDIGWSNNGFYGEFIEKGHALVKKKDGKKHYSKKFNSIQVGFVKAVPHLRPAVDENREKILDRMFITAKQKLGG